MFLTDGGDSVTSGPVDQSLGGLERPGLMLCCIQVASLPPPDPRPRAHNSDSGSAELNQEVIVSLMKGKKKKKREVL